MKQPNGDLNQLLRTLDSGARFTVNDVRPDVEPVPDSAMHADDAKYLNERLREIHGGAEYLLIVHGPDDSLRYVYHVTEDFHVLMMLHQVGMAIGHRFRK